MRKSVVLLGAMVAVLVAAGVRAGDVQLAKDAKAATETAVVSAGQVGPPNTPWGPQRGAKWIAASQFAITLSGGPTLDYDTFHFYLSPGSASPTGYFAQMDVEPGALVDMVTCAYRDFSATNEVSFSIQKYTSDVCSGTNTSGTLASFTSSGTPGQTYENLAISPSETISTLVGCNLINYYIRTDIAGDTSLAGCWVFYQRQVVPGPATATFGDVPTSSPYFKYVEALAAANVVGGCGSGNYCPNSPVTRGQMAVFLALSLGMGYPQ